MNSFTYTWQWERIDTRLSSQFLYSRSFFHHIISRWGIKVWSKTIKKSYKLKNNDEVFIDDLKRYLSPVILEEAPQIQIPIVLEKEDYIVINKPKWVLSHPNSVWEVSYPSVVWFLYHNFKNLPSIWNFIRAGLIHRLDKDTDGLMIIAKTEKWLAHFKELFQQKSSIMLSPNVILSKSEGSKKIVENISEQQTPIRKFYKATSIITILWEEFIKKIANNLPYYIQETVHAKVPNPTPKMGITKILEIKQDTDDTANLKLEILTGRTHQIRYHLSNHGLPILWDYLYWNEDENYQMQLTAYRLEFTDPDWKKINLKI
jgi:23S rRNA pseudouridine1911/1915/1917 synthase